MTYWNYEWTSKKNIQLANDVDKQMKSIRWREIKREILQKFGSFEELNVIELGAGKNTYSLLFAGEGADVTVTDYSTEALKISKNLFKMWGLKANFKLFDIIKINSNYSSQFDVSMSFGFVEHFEGEKRKQAIKSHIDILKQTGLTFISFPNKYNPFYRLGQIVADYNMGFELEIPFSRREFIQISESLDVKNIHFLGDSFLNSINWINPLKLIETNNFLEKMFIDKPSILDDQLSYSLVYVAEKNSSIQR